MIDIEVDVFDAVYPYIADLVPEGGFVSEYVPAPAFLPHVSLMEIDNIPDGKTRETGNSEYSSIVTFEAQVFATSRADCRQIAAALDDAMIGHMGFSKVMGQQIPNQADIRIFRYVARFRRGVTRTGDLYKP